MSAVILIFAGFVLGTMVAITNPAFPVAVHAWLKKHFS